MQCLTRASPAKINLTLRVCGRRADGFHEIESLVARISLWDIVTVSPRDDEQLTLTCDDPRVPQDERNLAWRAVRYLRAATGTTQGVCVSIQKWVPTGAGLGGGSSNAATVLMLLNELWHLGLSSHELAEIGAQVGSDVPLFFSTPLCIVRGRGERVEEVRQRLAARVLLLLPPLHSPTAAVYEAWDRVGARRTRPPLQELLHGLNQPEETAALLFNDLEEAACAVNPELRRFAEELRHACPGPVQMTGSGAAFFWLETGRGGGLTEVERAVRHARPNVRTVPAEIAS